jgi:uncharacterized tellurite resistance protein B-like protein
MLATIREFFDRHLAAPEARQREHTLELAGAALLVEALRSDGTVTEAEQAAVLRAVRERFGLSMEEADTLVALAAEASRQAHDFYQFTSLINRQYAQHEKEHLIELMWRVAYADGNLDVYESHLIRKIADLLYVPHRAYIAAKMRARDDAAKGTDTHHAGT